MTWFLATRPAVFALAVIVPPSEENEASIRSAGHGSPALEALSPELANETVLTATLAGDGGAVDGVAGDDAAATQTYSRADLAELGLISFETTTIWTEGPQRFEGVALLSLVDALGLESGSLHLSAVNDYSIDIGLADLTPEAPIIAIFRNDEPMTLREKGPLWVIYPFDSNPEYQSEVIYGRSIWQLDRISILSGEGGT